jgi:predicted negative regulator of RcsB-dependent stress response
MAQTKKVVPLKLKPKETDEFYSFSTKLLEFAQRNLTAILTGLAVLIIAGAVWGYLQKRQTDRQEKAAELYQAAIMAQQKPNIPTMLKELQIIIQDYPDTGGALQARLLTANLLYQEKKYQEASAAFEALGKEAPDVKILVAENLSYCYEAQKDYQKAAAVLDPLVEMADLPYRQELLRRQALLFELAGDQNKALAIYQKMLQDNPSESFAPYLQEKIKALEAKKS